MKLDLVNWQFDRESTRILRQVAHGTPRSLATPDHLRAAVNYPTRALLPIVALRPGPELVGVFERARCLATLRRGRCIGVSDLREALAEQTALEAGLDLQRLRFTRWRLQRLYATPLGLRTTTAEAVLSA
jgi:hypothetical protein